METLCVMLRRQQLKTTVGNDCSQVSLEKQRKRERLIMKTRGVVLGDDRKLTSIPEALWTDLTDSVTRKIERNEITGEKTFTTKPLTGTIYEDAIECLGHQ